MTKIQNTVVQAIGKIQSSSGRKLPKVTGATCPLTDIPGFDSLNAVEVSSILSSKLGREVPGDLMFPQGSGKPPTVDEIAEKLTAMIEKEAEKENE
jgi:acyl carrier protein